MNDATDRLIVGLMVVIACAVLCLVSLGIYSILEKEKIKSGFYAECIITDYDKFECYSMIYGDK